jgi:broad specificity phosphatase PhoE
MVTGSHGRTRPDENEPHGALGVSAASGAVVVYTHDAVVRAAVAWALRTGPKVYLDVEVASCSITTLRVLGGVRRLVRANEVGHLERRGRKGY